MPLPMKTASPTLDPSPESPDSQPLRADERDLGFGPVVARDTRRRLLNRDGSFNVRREGQAFSIYHFLLTVSWPRFLLFVTGSYVAMNLLFAALYYACGPGALVSSHTSASNGRFADAFFFSVHTLATIGYGSISPGNLASNLVVTVESLLGLLLFALAAGVVFARFARPTAQIVFSDRALISPYQNGGRALMFRIANSRSNQLMNLEARVLLSRFSDPVARTDREFLALDLERERVVFFPLTWTVVHPINEISPLFGASEESLRASDLEILILLSGTDETFAQTVHARSSYKWNEVVFGAKFRSMFEPISGDDEISVDIRQLDDFDQVTF